MFSSGVIGGHTIFPMLDLAIKPKPHAAIVWYGRDQAGVADIRWDNTPYFIRNKITLLF